ncbi:hypothetical protein G6F70_001779 [Rhizopus microsporus]|nr:hypothetical protein G6F71_000773 [Rhizopus microsporus]KAG1202978.1 hypothetical protein G6F70_001779 [Rhizopus microsporus]KAG1214880.1 hypothetical protein G6F69_001517 [Rhizopus microsporus]KAG1236898.1 hypothetical protein G6F67_001623 [Rhizopus microsporus]KAG1266973.1 hypothetical protein G6F68_002317 [Rhizopus microsporus]
MEERCPNQHKDQKQTYESPVTSSSGSSPMNNMIHPSNLPAGHWRHSYSSEPFQLYDQHDLYTKAYSSYPQSYYHGESFYSGYHAANHSPWAETAEPSSSTSYFDRNVSNYSSTETYSSTRVQRASSIYPDIVSGVNNENRSQPTHQGTSKQQGPSDTKDNSAQGHKIPEVEQLQEEISFLSDEITTILIVLDSLRNAFLTDYTFTATPSLLVRDNRPMLKTLSFAKNDRISLNQTTYITGIDSNIKGNALDIINNPEVEKEIRIAYDDLAMQVKQLERKIDTLEKKSRKIMTENRKRSLDTSQADASILHHQLHGNIHQAHMLTLCTPP